MKRFVLISMLILLAVPAFAQGSTITCWSPRDHSSKILQVVRDAVEVPLGKADLVQLEHINHSFVAVPSHNIMVDENGQMIGYHEQWLARQDMGGVKLITEIIDLYFDIDGIPRLGFYKVRTSQPEDTQPTFEKINLTCR